jgi:hypothetical protein
MNWEKIKNTNTIIQIILGIILLGSAIGITNEIIIKGLDFKISIWSAVLLIAISFLFGFYTGKKNKIKKINKKINSNNINLEFHDNPEKLGWNLGVDRESNVKPEIAIGSDGNYGYFWQITAHDSYYLDYSLNISKYAFNKLSFVIQNNKPCTVYAKVQLKSRNNELEKSGWISLKEGDVEAKPHGSGKYEWTFYDLPNSVDNNWKEFKIILPEAVKHTFGNEGWVYNRITGLRIRGSINIAEIKIE